MMIDSPAPIEIWEEPFNNADYLHQRYQSEGRPREIVIKAPTPGIHMHPTAIPSLIHHPNDTDKDCAIMIYSQTPTEIWENAFNNADYLHQRYPSEGRPREIAIKRRPLHHLQRFRQSQLSTIRINRQKKRVEMDFSVTAHIPEMDFAEYNTKKRVEMDFSMTTQEPVERV